MAERSFFEAIEAGDPKLALEILDERFKAAAAKATANSKAAGLSIYDEHLQRWISPEEPDPYAEERGHWDDLRVRSSKSPARPEQ